MSAAADLFRPAPITDREGLLRWFDGLSEDDLYNIFSTDFGLLDYDGYDFAGDVAGILAGIRHYANVEGFNYSILTGIDGSGIDGFEVQHEVGPSFYIGGFTDISDMTSDRTLTGRDQARAVVDTIGWQYDRVRKWVTEHVS